MTRSSIPCTGCQRILNLPWAICPFCLAPKNNSVPQEEVVHLSRTEESEAECTECGGLLLNLDDTLCFKCRTVSFEQQSEPESTVRPASITEEIVMGSSSQEDSGDTNFIIPEQASTTDAFNEHGGINFDRYSRKYLSPFWREREQGVTYDVSTITKLLNYTDSIRIHVSWDRSKIHTFLKDQVCKINDENYSDINAQMYHITKSMHAPAILGNRVNPKPRWSRSNILNFFELHGYFLREDGELETGSSLLSLLGYETVEQYFDDSFNQSK